MTYVCSLEPSSSDRVSGKIVITTLSDLYIALSDSNARLIELEDDFVDKYFTPKSLESFIVEAKRLNKFLQFNVASKKFSPFDRSIDEMLSIKSTEDFIAYVLKDREALNHVHTLCKEYKAEKEEVLRAGAKMGTLHLQLTECYKQIEKLKNENVVLKEVNERNNSKLQTLISRINYKYDQNINENKMFGLKVDFRRYSKVLYVKEITRVLYVDTLLYYLQEILKTLHGVPTRFVAIEAPLGYKRDYLYPRCKSHLNLTYEDIYNSDIFMAGFHYTLMEDILKNPSNAKFLIILDRSGWEQPYVYGDGVEPIYCASDFKDVRDNIALKRVISYSKDTLNIPHIKNFENLSTEERIGKYSSMSIMHALIELMERGD